MVYDLQISWIVQCSKYEHSQLGIQFVEVWKSKIEFQQLSKMYNLGMYGLGFEKDFLFLEHCK